MVNMSWLRYEDVVVTVSGENVLANGFDIRLLLGEHVVANLGDGVSKWGRSRRYSGENVMTNWERKWLYGKTGMAKGGKCDD